jgi:Ca2+-transporting ATPase
MVGLVGLEDPLRPSVASAVAACRAAQVRVVMITGDHPQTARAIAKKIDLDARALLTGPEIDAMDDRALAEALERCSVIARAVPAHKLRIVQALEARGLRVAMTGDGVNDAPALKAAHIGIAMGARGTDVAREAAGLVLVRDDFAAIVAAIELGRRIYDNLRNAFGYIVAVHLPIAGVALASAMLRWETLLYPVHVVFLELVIDPACSIVFEMEPGDERAMQRPPRAPDAPLFDRARLAFALAQGALACAATVAIVGRARLERLSLEQQRSLVLASLVSANLAILLTSRAVDQPFWRTLARKNRAVPALLAAALALTTLLVTTRVGTLFSLSPASPASVLAAAALAAFPVLMLDSIKVFRARP